MPDSTVGAILRRLGLGKRAALEAKPPVRYERQRLGGMIVTVRGRPSCRPALVGLVSIGASASINPGVRDVRWQG